MSWQEMDRGDRIRKIAELAGEGLSASGIAQRIGGVSRNAIIGYARRHGVKFARTQGDHLTKIEKMSESAKARGRPGRRAKSLVMVKAETSFADRPAEVKATPLSPPTTGNRSRLFDPLPGVKPVRIEDMPLFGCCRWPVNGDGAEGIFCGCATVPNTKVYCSTHTRFARSKEVSHGENS